MTGHPEIRLVIFDCYDTIIMPDGENWFTPRVNIEPVLEELLKKSIRIAVSTDELEAEGEYNCYDHLGKLADYFKYDAEKQRYSIYRGDTMSYSVTERRFLKDLSGICKDQGTEPEHSVMVGDDRNNVDSLSAAYHYVRFIKVPASIDDPYYDMKNILKMIIRR